MSEEIVPLVEFRNGQYVARGDTLAWLSTRTKPFAVVTCAGKFRTGKSFLLNRILRCSPGKGFGVGETVQACTRGIWVCKRFLSSENEGDPDLLICDTEGIDALDAESEHDVRVFAMGVLLCSVFLYNSQSHLDEAAVQTLSLMTRIAESVGGKHEPHMYWVLRDFSLQLVDDEGKQITHSEYLERSLSPPVAEKCKTREAIKSVFRTRHLVTLPRPHKSESSQKLDLKGPSAISSKFDRFLNTFRTHMQENAPPVTANGVPMTGTVYGEYVRNLVSKLNEDGAVPKMEDSWSLIRQTQCHEWENAYRRVLTDRLAECPHGNREEVMAWIESIPYTVPAFVQDAEDVVKRVRDEVYKLCVSTGRIIQPHELVQREMETILSTRKDDILSMMAPPPSSEMSEYGRVVWGVLQTGVAMGVERGTLRAKEETQLECLEMQATVESLERELDAARSVERSLSPAAKKPVCMDASVGTEDPSLYPDRAVTPPPELVDMQSDGTMQLRLDEKEAQIKILQDKVHELGKRERDVKRVFEETMDELRNTTQDKLAQMKEAVEHHKVNAAKEMRQREILVEECDKNRQLLRTAQEKAVDVHKSMLDELRRRDSEMRTVDDEKRKEWSALNVKLELTENEARGLKHRLDEMQDVEGEAKRLRSSVRKLEMEKVRDDAQMNHQKQHLESCRSELATLRRTNVDLESRLAVLEATSKLESCRRAIE